MSNKPPSPKPMPTTGMPDRLDPNARSDMDMKRGVTSTGTSSITNGRKPTK